MKENNIGFLLIPVATALAFLLPLSMPSGTAPATALQAIVSESPNPVASLPKPSAKPKHSGNAAKLLCEFFGKDRECSLNELRAERVSDAKQPCGTSRQTPQNEYEWELLIATLPDPRDSRFGYLFDRNLDAIQRAVEAAGYVLDRFDLPWQDRKTSKSENPDAEEKDSTKKARYRRQPGVVLFHDSDNCDHGASVRNKLLVLFLVGETPTAGVNHVVLTDALRQVEELADWPNNADRRVRLLAPLFSGSQDSLAFTLQSWLAALDEKTRPIPFVLSGSAMAVDEKKFHRRLAPLFANVRPSDDLDGRAIYPYDFHSTVLSSEFATQTMLNYFVELERKVPGDKPFTVALLTEGNTAFGSAVRDQYDKYDKPVQTQTPLTPENTPRPAPTPTTLYRVLKLPFPLHISQLRSATEKVKSDSNQTATPLEWRGSKRPLLPLLMEENFESVDAVPLFSGLETASAELVLSNLLEEINRERIRYVGVIASDVKDVIFLVSQIRRHCPNTVPFTLLADLLYLRPEINPDLAGTLVVTTYPLFVQNQLWSAPFDGATNRIQFPSHISQGAYNATLALLGMPGKMREYGSPFDLSFQPSTPTPALRKRQPSLWVSLVGANNLWPVRAIHHSGNQSYTYATNTNVELPESLSIQFRSGFDSKISFSVILLLSLLGALISLSALAQLINTEFEERQPQVHRVQHPDAKLIWRWLRRIRFLGLGLIERSWFGETFGDPVFREKHQFERRVYLFICCLSLLGIYLLMLWIAVLPSWVTKYSTLHTSAFSLSNWVPGWASYQRLPVEWESSYRWLRVLFTCLSIIAAIPTIWLWSSLCDWCYWKGLDRWQGWRAQPDSTAPASPSASAQQVPLAETASAEPLSRIKTLLPNWFGVVIGLLTTFGAVWGGYYLLNRRSPVEHLFFFLRASDLTSGVSPLLPLLLVGSAAFLWAFCELRRLSLVERLPDNVRKASSFLNFEQATTPSFAGVRRLEGQVLFIVKQHLLALPAKWLLLGMLTAPAIYVWYRAIPSIEGIAFDRGFALGFFIVSLAQGLAFARFFFLWGALRRLLRRLSHHPLFGQPLPADQKERFVGFPKLNLAAPQPNYIPLAFSLQQADRVYRLRGEAPPAALVSADAALQRALESKAENRWREALRDRCKAQAALADVSQQVVQLLEPRWHLPKPNANPAEKKNAALDVGKEQESPAWVRQAEFYLASCVAGFLHQILAHVQNLAVFVTTSLILLLMAITSYPFHPRELFLLFGWLLIVTTVAVMLVVFAQMSRDAVLSELSGTTPDQVNWSRDFLLRFALHGLLPILALLGAQFPEVFRQAFAWLSMLQGGKG